MTTIVPWQYPGKKLTTHATTGDLASAGSLPQEELDAQKVSQIVKQLKGGCVKNSEFNQISQTSHLSEDDVDLMGQAALTANVEYYRALCDKARRTHQEYVAARDFWQSRLDKITKTLD